MLTPVAGRLDFEFERQMWSLEFDFAAIAFFERIAEVSISKVFRDLASRTPLVSHTVWLLQAGLQKHHPGATADLANAMLSAPEVQQALDLSIAAALPDPEPGGNVAAATSPAAPNGTGTSSSPGPSKRGSRRRSSGKAPRAPTG